MIKKTLLWIIFLLWPSFILATDGFKLLESSEKGVLLEFTPQEWRQHKIKINGRTYWRIEFAGSSIEGKAGEPQIPLGIAIIGVPLDSKISYKIVGADYQEIRNIRLAPIPQLVHKGDIGVPRYIEREGIYRSTEFFPKTILQIEGPGFFGDIRIIRVKFYPLQFAPERGLIRRYQRILVRIDFGGGRKAARGAVPRSNIYQDVILNFEVAKNWLKGKEDQGVKKAPLPQQGERYKIALRREGIYKLDGKILSSAGVDLSAIDPATIKIFNNGGRELPKDLNAPRPAALMENAILVVGIEDGKFDPSDYILFYGKSVEGWDYDSGNKEYSHYINHYTRENVYWLVFNDGRPGKRMVQIPSPPGNGLPARVKFRDRLFLEEELNNAYTLYPYASALEWYGRGFTKTDNIREYILYLPDAVVSDTINFKLCLKGGTRHSHHFDVYFNDSWISDTSFQGPSHVVLSAFAVENIKDGVNKLKIVYSGETHEEQAYLDWYEVEYSRRLRAVDDRLLFYSPDTTGLVKYRISGFSGRDVQVYDVTDFSDVRQIIPSEISEGSIIFSDYVYSGKPKRYIALTPSAYLTPLYIEKNIPSHLRDPSKAADFIIITHRDFYDQAMALKNLREGWDELQTMVVKISDIYDEFSWGLFDPTAIRDFLKYAHDNWARSPSYVLLLGDGDYDYKNIINPTDENWIPPYEGVGRATDDWYTYISGDDRYMDMAIGRIPVRSPEEAEDVIEKIIQYETDPFMGSWRNTITLVADDEISPDSQSETEHIYGSEEIARKCLPRSFDLKKIYLTEYPGVYDPAVGRIVKPAAADAFVDQINRGSLIINYIGHGNDQLLAHEFIFTSSRDLPRIHNEMRLGIWFVASCEFGEYDDPQEQSCTEELLIAQRRGAIAVISSARLAVGGANIILDKNFLRNLFPSPGRTRRIGDALRLAKLITGYISNNEKYHLFGDPTMRLAAPRLQALITSMKPDSLRALSKITVSGIVRRDGEELDTFNGSVLLKAFDSQKIRTHYTSRGIPLHYTLPGNAIFRGEGVVENGRFTLSFIVPKDITYGGDLGRISLYLWNEEEDGAGYRDSLKVGGTAKDLVDFKGPDIELSIKGKEFFSGDFTGTDPVLIAHIRDDVSGVNITGEIGHKITLILDGRKEDQRDLTDFFKYNRGSYLEGIIEYQLTDLSEGRHIAEVKAWDNANNSSTASLEFTVVPEDKLILKDVLNYPNPFSSNTTFTFIISQDAKVSIKIYTLAGRLIRVLDDIEAQRGFNMVSWDGRDQNGDSLANGVYLYKIIAKAHSSRTTLSTEAIGKLMIMR